MSPLLLQISNAAATDILEQADWYEASGSEELALQWQRAVTRSVLQILEYPNSGPIAGFKNPVLSTVRRIAVDEFARHLIFYRLTETTVHILRVLHGARDWDSLFS